MSIDHLPRPKTTPKKKESKKHLSELLDQILEEIDDVLVENSAPIDRGV